MLPYIALGLLLQTTNAMDHFMAHDKFGAAKAYSDLVSLNPPVASQMGAIWAKDNNQLKEWTLEVKYRVNGPEHGGKGMVVWYAADRGKGGPIYGSVDNWDGLGLFLTAEPDGSGALRGHLNDRTVQFSKLEDAGGNPFGLNRLFAKSDAEKNSFGSCSFKYRNVGTIGSIKLSYNLESLKVMHDDVLCFENFDVSLPTGHYFGVSAQASEAPDSHELFAFESTKKSHISGQRSKQSTDEKGRPAFNAPNAPNAPVALDTAMQKIITKLIADSDKMSARIEEISSMKSTIERIESALGNLNTAQQGGPIGESSGFSKTMYDDLKREIRGMEDKFLAIERHIEKQTDHIVASLPPVAKPLKTAVTLIILVQLAICGAYIMYRRRTEEKSKFL